MVTTASYGTWKSPITADSIIENSASIDDVIVDPVTSAIYHIESRPNEGGRNVLIKTEGNTDLFGEGWNCRTGVEEYGGGAATAHNGVIYFSNFKDGRVYALKEGGQPEAITPENSAQRFADFAIHPTQNHIIVAVLEDHTQPEPANVVTSLCFINTHTKTVHPLVSGVDFYAAPAFSPDGNHLVWQQWKHPDMPWEGGEIHVGPVTYNASSQSISVTNSHHVAGKHSEASAAYPFWINNDTFVFTVDVSGFQNPWTYTLSTKKSAPILPQPRDEEFSLPGWQLGASYGVVAHPGDDTTHSTVLFSAFKDGRSRLYLLTLHSGAIEELACPYVAIANVRRVADGHVVFVGGKVDEGATLVQCSVKDYAAPHFTVLSGATKSSFSPAFFSKPQSITLHTDEKEPLYVLYYPPTNPEYEAPEGERPPAIVSVHGGPTSHERQGLKMTVQYFTSRGWAWIGVDYGGSSGHGRKYIERLKGNWGVVDTRDCVLAAQQLASASHALIDPKRTAIRGGSSGGYTVLETLCLYPDAFAAGTSLYGISDLVKLAEFTHKFESQYMAKLLGGFVTDEKVRKVYVERSPVNNAGRIRSPLLIEQGSLDAVVPPAQAEDIVKSIKANGGSVEYVVFEGEGHGWRKAENIKAALEKEREFYERIFKLNA
ncbi:hypothetical protein EIP91_012014 [Steccherinum ochraceum]|uniref:Peptidase S9 prolyl oligopeptidase catalytic domain-containing protein n=1 Tax=Steccherinum ochraceum TaxID=92696 RepID=A0A4V2MWV2_9APHY|nr:hypothetical protein EIP91_012014 [Steccherinum ochraceum]